MKNLIYTTLGFDANYSTCIEMLIESIAMSTGSHDAFDFLVICDKKVYKDVISRFERKTFKFSVKFYIVESAKTTMEASINKLRVFEYPFVSAYDKILFLDCDIIVNLDIMRVFDKSIDHQQCLIYAYKEKDDVKEHLSGFWSLGTYTEKDIEFFKENKIFPFNAGCFLFANTETMKGHFRDVLNWIGSYKGVYFYEQSFMNVYFNTRKMVRYNIIDDDNYVMFPDVERAYPEKMIHFCGFPGNGKNKVEVMSRYWDKFIVPVKNNRPVIRRNKIL